MEESQSFDDLATEAHQRERAAKGARGSAMQTQASRQREADLAWRQVLEEAVGWLTGRGAATDALEVSVDGRRVREVGDLWWLGRDDWALSRDARLVRTRLAGSQSFPWTLPGSSPGRTAQEKRRRKVMDAAQDLARRRGCSRAVEVVSVLSATPWPTCLYADEAGKFCYDDAAGVVRWAAWRDTIAPVDPSTAPTARSVLAGALGPRFS